jgi:hypothetical protein
VTTVLLVVVRIAILAVVATRRSGYSAHSRLALGIEVDLVHGGGRVAQTLRGARLVTTGEGCWPASTV